MIGKMEGELLEKGYLIKFGLGHPHGNRSGIEIFVLCVLIEILILISSSYMCVLFIHCPMSTTRQGIFS